MNTKLMLKNIFLVFLTVILLGLPSISVKASTCSVTFGSTNYRWEDGTTNPIGVYVSGDEAITSYEVTLTYDSSYLKYVGGASEVRGTTLILKGGSKEAGYRHTLQFEVIKEGNTRIRVVSASALTEEKVVSVSGNDVKKEKQQFTFTQLATAPIATSDSVSSMLAELSLIPNVLTDFKTENLEYHVEVPYEVEELQVNYVLEDANATATLSDTRLSVGENEITLMVKGSLEETTYRIYAVRKEETVAPPVESSIEDSKETEQPSSSEEITGLEETKPSVEEINSSEESVAEKESEEKEPESFLETSKHVQNILLIIGTVFVFALMILYFISAIKQRILEANTRKNDKTDVKIVNLEGTVISVKNVTMKFKMAKDESSSLKEYLIRTLKKKNEYTYLTALNNISFDVMQGDVVGIIGSNGSGKSTMLKIVSGALMPTKGKVRVDRSKVQMLTLGTGFDMELTARENVYLNGSIIGYTREYIEEKYDDIVKFAELEGFMEERMKNFSSGMVSRLGFAIATMRDAPDILILDEVLSVGDMFFKKKSEQRIKEMIHGGATVLIVSHSIETIKKNCNKVVWIEKGVLQMVGDPKIVCEAYAKKNNLTV